ncbi:uncharacterized protein LOC142973435 [Anticarsia gemmatalis]|uniref:uncharacterized protein LOC142973435 n=1 Tax=Anticarsia gemmatalis TaxID=129554 RepID=UPI003F763CDF
MEGFTGHYKSTKTTEFLILLNKFAFFFGLPNYWIEDLEFPGNFYKHNHQINKFGNMCSYILIFSEYGAFFTQKNLSDKQAYYLKIYVLAHTIVTLFRIRVTYRHSEIKELMYKLGIRLKEVYNDLLVEELMIKKAKFFSVAFWVCCIISVMLMTLEACLKVIFVGEPFNTIITVVPDVNDNSLSSNIIRAIYYVLWWVYITRIFSVYALVICLTTAVSFQFMNLNSYFKSLDGIFEEEHLMRKEKEAKYEAALKIGIKLHDETLKCTDELQTICQEVFSGQIMFNLILLTLLMYQMVHSDRTLANTLTVIVTASSILLSTGFFMWNAGDITVEAEGLSTSIFCSGWENCYNDSSIRVRKLIVIAMMRAQQPVILTGFGIITLSYQSFVSIIKSSYSVFSVMY